MGFTKRELIEFLDGLVELASEENKVKAVLAKEKFISDFENTYGYEKEVITEVSKLPPHYIAAMPDSVQEEIRQKVIAALADRTMEEIYRLSAAREAGGVDGNSCSIKRVQRHMAERGLRSVVEKKYRERGDFSRGQCPLGLSPAYLVIVQGGFQKC